MTQKIKTKKTSDTQIRQALSKISGVPEKPRFSVEDYLAEVLKHSNCSLYKYGNLDCHIVYDRLPVVGQIVNIKRNSTICKIMDTSPDDLFLFTDAVFSGKDSLFLCGYGAMTDAHDLLTAKMEDGIYVCNHIKHKLPNAFYLIYAIQLKGLLFTYHN